MFSAASTIRDVSAEQEKKSCQIGVRMSQRERNAIVAASQSEHRTPSDFIRRVVIDWIEGHRPAAAYGEETLTRLKVLRFIERHSPDLLAAVLELGSRGVLDEDLGRALRHLRAALVSRQPSPPTRGRGGRRVRTVETAPQRAETE